MTFRRSVLTLACLCLIATPVVAHPGSGIAVDRRGQVYFLDTGSGLWKIDTDGKISKLPGQRFHWMALDPKDAFAKARLPTGPDCEFERSGAGPTVLLSSDYPIAVGQDDNLYSTQRGPRGELQIIRRTPAGETATVATPPPTPKGPIEHINGIAFGPDGALYYTEYGAIRKITPQGKISTVVTVPPMPNGPSIPGIGADARPELRGLAIDAHGVIYVAASGCARVLKITPDGKITTLLQLESPWSPTAVAVSGGDVYVLEYLHTARDVRSDWLPRVRKIAADGKATVIASVDRMPGAREASK